MNIFAESQDSPLIKAGSNVFGVNHERKIFEGIANKRRQFPELKYGNNAESPNFLKVSNLYDNAFSNKNHKSADPIVNSNDNGYSQSDYLNRLIDNLVNGTQDKNSDLNLNMKISKDMEIYMPKLTNRMKKALNISEDEKNRNDNKNYGNNSKNNQLYASADNSNGFMYSFKKLEGQNQNQNGINNVQYVNPKITNDIRKSFESQNLPREKPFYESAPYLNNINEYSIKESYRVNEDRILKYNKKNIVDYNCIIGQKVSVSPPKFSVDKWPLFYEKYFTIFNFYK
jgi:hypothetical protein